MSLGRPANRSPPPRKPMEPFGLPCLGGMTFPAASCFAVGGVEEAVGGFLELEFIEKTAAPLHFPPTPPRASFCGRMELGRKLWQG